MDKPSPFNSPEVLHYGSGETSGGTSRRLLLPRSIVLASLIPIAVFFALLLTVNHWKHWFHIGQGHEQFLGLLWLATAAFSFASMVVFAFSRKRWDVWVCLVLHGLMLAFTVFPGFFAIEWLMGWGPPGPGS